VYLPALNGGGYGPSSTEALYETGIVCALLAAEAVVEVRDVEPSGGDAGEEMEEAEGVGAAGDEADDLAAGRDQVVPADVLLGARAGKLDTVRWQSLVLQCRAAKEALLGGVTAAAAVQLPGRGRGVVAGTLTEQVIMADVERLVIEGRLLAVTGLPDDALARFDDALRVFNGRGDRHEHAVRLGDAARIRMEKGEVDAALALHRERLQVLEELGKKKHPQEGEPAPGRLEIADQTALRERESSSPTAG
jgi:hypothetical protein